MGLRQRNGPFFAAEGSRVLLKSKACCGSGDGLQALRVTAKVWVYEIGLALSGNVIVT